MRTEPADRIFFLSVCLFVKFCFESVGNLQRFAEQLTHRLFIRLDPTSPFR